MKTELESMVARPAGAVSSIADERIVLAHGGGGELTAGLVRAHVLPQLANEALSALGDGAVLDWPSGSLVLTTDSYVVTPLEFAGGDIGRLAVCGTVNDLAVMGAQPVALSLGLILEEGLPLEVLDRIVSSIATAADEAGVRVVTGDTKVIERRAAAPTSNGDERGTAREGMFINTAGVGRLRGDARLEIERIEPGDAVIVSGTLADHGLAIMSMRNGLEFDTPLRSDVAPLNGLIGRLLESGADVRFMRDATRGGLAGVLADVSERRGVSIEIDESAIPILPAARHAAEMLGLDLLSTANEGKVVAIVAARDARRALAALRGHTLGTRAAVIGRITDAQPPLVELLTRIAGRRIVQRPYGEDLPRIC
ncbi:MAG: hydrogenase expression/formation protein HypE [Phycisphaerae bacterium]|nr:hydrogenase expression/formation protein HypE [Phycisphaerae bacterium]NUQ45633.1 hydrogenase expression/formation protein HypE [Phycisphaerae bacterium]